MVSLHPHRVSLWLLSMLVLGTSLVSAPAGAEEGTLDQLVGEIDRKVATALHGRAIARDDLVCVLREGRGLRGAETLSPTVRRLLLGRLNRRGFRSIRWMKTDASGDALVALARRQGAELLFRFTLGIEGGYLRLQGEIVEVGASLWRDLLQPRRGSLAFIFGRVRVDAEVHAFFRHQVTTRRTFAMRSFSVGRRPLVALAARDLDGDGRVDLLALSRERLSIFDLPRGTRSRYVLRSALVLTGALASLGSRRDLGSLLVADLDGDRRLEIYLRTSTRQRAAVLRFAGGKLRLLRELAEVYPLAVWEDRGKRYRLDAAAASGGDFFRSVDLRRPPLHDPVSPASLRATSQPVTHATAGTPTTAPGAARRPAVTSRPAAPIAFHPAGLPTDFYGLVMARVATTSGPRRYGALVDLNGRLHLLDGALAKTLATVDDVGVAFDVVDLDDDGRLEVVTTGADERGIEDRLAVYRLTRAGHLRLLWRSARLGGRVTALTHGDLDGDGKLEIVAALFDRKGRCRLIQVD